MIVKTRNYRLEKKNYIKMALKAILKQQWWVSLIVVAICALYLWIPSVWWFIGALIGAGLYLLFWWIQFYGVTQLDQGKMLFERFSYEISSQYFDGTKSFLDSCFLILITGHISNISMSVTAIKAIPITGKWTSVDYLISPLFLKILIKNLRSLSVLKILKGK